MADYDTMDVDDADTTPAVFKEKETPFSEEFSRLDAVATADPAEGVKAWLGVGGLRH
jgi:hypothetical protein